MKKTPLIIFPVKQRALPRFRRLSDRQRRSEIYIKMSFKIEAVNEF